jgi:hypothetical protein
MVGFIDDHRDHFGVEPICAVPIAPSTYFLGDHQVAGEGGGAHEAAPSSQPS